MNLGDDDFTLFGFPPRQAMNLAELDARRRELQGRVHPDRFASDGAAAQRLAMQWAVRINEAYARLRDPLSRGAYLCAMRGVPVDAEQNTSMPPAFLAQQMEWREALAEADRVDDVDRIAEAVHAEEQQRLQALSSLLDEGGDTAAAAAQVRALMFLARFRHDLSRRLDALDPTR